MENLNVTSMPQSEKQEVKDFYQQIKDRYGSRAFDYYYAESIMDDLEASTLNSRQKQFFLLIVIMLKR